MELVSQVRYMFQISRKPRGMSGVNCSKLQLGRSEPDHMTGRLTYSLSGGTNVTN
jgi:hypothetical protein